MTRPAGQDALTSPDGGALLPDAFVFRPVRAWGSVAILVLFSLCSIMDRQVMSLMVDPIKQDLGLSDSQLGLLQGFAFALFYSIAGLPIGWAVDRFSRRWVVFAGIMFWSISALSCGLARNFGQLFAARSCVGVGEAALGPSAVSLISDIFPPKRAALPLSVYSAGFYVGSGVALGVGGWIVSALSGHASVALPLVGDVAPWQAVFIITSLPGLVIAFLAFALYDNRPRTRARKAVGSQDQTFGAFLVQRRAVIALAIAGFATATFVSYAASAWTPSFFIRVHGWDPGRFGITYGVVIAAAGIIGALLGGLVVDRVGRAGRVDATLWVPGCTALAAIGPYVSAYLVSSANLALFLIFIALTILGAVGGASYAVWQVIAPSQFRGRLTAIYILTVSLLGAGLGPVVVGVITDYIFGDPLAVGKSIALTVGIALPLMALILFAGSTKLRQMLE